MNTKSEAGDTESTARGKGVIIKISMAEADAEKFQALLADGTLNEFLDKYGVASITLEPQVASGTAVTKWTAEADRQRMQKSRPQTPQP